MAINFAGGTDRISYQVGLGAFTTGCFAFRMKTTQTTANAVPISIWNSGSRFGFGFVLNNTANKLLVQVCDSNGTPKVQLLSSTSVNDGNWHSIAFNWNQNNGAANTLFVNGAQEATANASTAWSNSTGALYLGDNNDTFWPSYVGDLAEVAVWCNRQLDAAEIAALGKDWSPSKIAPGVLNGLTFHAPLVRSPNNRFDSFLGSQVGTTVTPHCRVVGGVW